MFDVDDIAIVVVVVVVVVVVAVDDTMESIILHITCARGGSAMGEAATLSTRRSGVYQQLWGYTSLICERLMNAGSSRLVKLLVDLGCDFGNALFGRNPSTRWKPCLGQACRCVKVQHHQNRVDIHYV